MLPRLAAITPLFAAALVAACASPAPAPRPAQPVAVTPRIADVHYSLTFDSTTSPARTLRVSMSFVADRSGPLLLSLPAWTPGAYEIANFARWVTDFSVTSGGAAAQWDKADHDTWRVSAKAGQPTTVAFTYTADTLDNAMAWSTDDFLMVNGTAVFLYPDSQPLDFASRVSVTTQAGWRVATGMTSSGGPREYSAASYHELVDMPLFVGHFDIDTGRVGGRPIRVASYPADGMTAGERATLMTQVERMLPPQEAVFGVTPFDAFTILQIIDTAYTGISALEHRNSFVVITAREALGSVPLASIFAHEFFHAWNVKQLRPAALQPYRYDGPQPTEWLWVSEGVTDYYADLSLVRGGIIDSAGFFAATVAKIVEVDTLPPVALEDASLSTWLRPVDGTHYLYYTKGSLAGLMLDILIRDASDNRGSLDVAMRELYERGVRERRGFTGEEWWAAMTRTAGGRSFDDFHARYIDGRDPYPWNTVLPLAGMRLVADTVREPVVGILVRQDTAGLVVAEVEARSAAARAGIREGDRLVSLGGIPVDAPDFGERVRAAYGSGAEAELPVGLRRGGRSISLIVPVTYLAVIEYSVVADEGAPDKAARIRSGLLRGSVNP